MHKPTIPHAGTRKHSRVECGTSRIARCAITAAPSAANTIARTSESEPTARSLRSHQRPYAPYIAARLSRPSNRRGIPTQGADSIGSDSWIVCARTPKGMRCIRLAARCLVWCALAGCGIMASAIAVQSTYRHLESPARRTRVLRLAREMHTPRGVPDRAPPFDLPANVLITAGDAGTGT